MKFQKGLLSDSEGKATGSEVSIKLSEQDRSVLKPLTDPERIPTIIAPIEVDKNRLFETVEETKNSSKKYLAVLGAVTAMVIVAASGGSYYFAPGIGDKILAPKGLEIALRDNLLTKQKREATEISYYKCQDLVWARVGAETRNDLPNPVFKIGTYAARAIRNGESWEITATPILLPEMDIPCN